MIKSKTINEFLRHACEKAEMTQMDAASFLGHSTAQYLSNLERGLCAPSVEMAIRLCEFYRAKRAEMYDVMVDAYERELSKTFKRARSAR